MVNQLISILEKEAKERTLDTAKIQQLQELSERLGCKKDLYEAPLQSAWKQNNNQFQQNVKRYNII